MAASIYTRESNGPQPELITVTDVQRMWRISAHALRCKRKVGLLPDQHSLRDTRTVLLRYSDLVKVLGEPVQSGPVR